jgi:hypothetical protein
LLLPLLRGQRPSPESIFQRAAGSDGRRCDWSSRPAPKRRWRLSIWTAILSHYRKSLSLPVGNDNCVPTLLSTICRPCPACCWPGLILLYFSPAPGQPCWPWGGGKTGDGRPPISKRKIAPLQGQLLPQVLSIACRPSSRFARVTGHPHAGRGLPSPGSGLGRRIAPRGIALPQIHM